MEDVHEFEIWLERMLKDSKEQLGMTDKTIAYILFREANGYYLRTIAKDYLEEK